MAVRYRDPCPLDCKVYVGELGSSGTRHEIEEEFGYYGPLRNVWVARNPPGFAFVMFEDPRDARDAVRALDGKVICGRRIKAELSTGKSRRDKPIVSRYPPSRESRYNQRIRSPVKNTDPRREYHTNYRDPHYEPREHYSKRYSKKHRSWSRSRSFSPPTQGQMGRPSRSGMQDSYNGHGQQSTNGNGLMKHSNHSRSRSRSPPSKSPRTESRYR